MRRGILTALGLAVAIATCAVVINRSDAALGRQQAAHREAAELIYLPPTPFLRAVSLGYQHVLADVLWFRTISYFGQQYRSDRLYPWLASMCDAVTDLDPRAEHVYHFAGVMLPWEADRIDDGIALLEKGSRNMPEAWRLHYMLGFSYYFFKNDLAAASQAFERATRLPDTPAFVSTMAATIFAAQQGPANAIAFLTELERNNPNEEMRGAIHERVLELALTRDIDTLTAAVATFESRFERRPADLRELVTQGIVDTIPNEPFGGAYVLDTETGAVTSSTGREPRRARSTPMRDRFLERQRHGTDPDRPPPSGPSLHAPRG